MNTTTNKSTLVNSIAILMSCTQHEAGLSKLSVPTLEAVYQGLLKNATSWQFVQEEVKAAKNETFIAKGRVASLEAEVRKLQRKLKEGK
jgi:hypothetical protein